MATVAVIPPSRGGLPAAIHQAYQQGAREITITPGTYELPASGADTIKLDSWTDTIIHARNVTLIFEELAHRPLHLNRCRNVTWDGGTLRFYDSLLHAGADQSGGKRRAR